MTCTFFGHKNTPKKIEPILRSTLIDLILTKNADTFYIGNNGNFDCMVMRVLNQLKTLYTHIEYTVVLAYIPGKAGDTLNEYDIETIYPEGMENVPLQYAIIRRNEWMIRRSDYVVTYVLRKTGGAVKSKEIAEKQHKTIIELSDMV